MKNSLFKKSLLGAALSAASLSSIAAPLDLDTSFDGDGMLTANYSVGGTYHTYFRDVEVTPNDKILAIGHTGNTSSTKVLLLVKYNLDGSLDTSFSTGGKVNLAVGNDTRGEALAIQPDGKLIVAGHSRASANDPWSVFVKRLNVDGSIDPSFTAYNFTSTATVNTVPSGSGVTVKGIALTANGKILVSMTEHHRTVVTGNPSRVDRARLVQLNLDGSVDTAFGTNGLTIRSHNNISYETGKLALSPAGDIFLPGKRLDVPVNTQSETMTMIKYDSTGNLDHFDGNLTGWKRRASISLTGALPKAIEQLSSALVLPDGNVISVGCIADYGNSGGANHNTARIQRQDADGNGLVAVNSPIGKQHTDTSLISHNNHPAVRNEHCFNDVTYHPSVGIIAVGGIKNGASAPIATPTWPSLATSRYIFTPAAGGNASTLVAQEHARRGTVNEGRLNAVAVTHGGKIVSVGYMLNSAAHEAVVHVTQGAPLPAAAATDSIGTLNFTDATDVTVSTAQSAFADNNISTTSTTGFTAQVYGGTAEVNNLAESNPITLEDGDSVNLAHTSASTAGTKTTTAIVVNNGTGFHRNNQTWAVGDTFAEFNSTTAQPDTTPDAFVISPRINTSINSVSSSVTTITGITVATPISISSGGEYSINGAGYTSAAGTINNNDAVRVRHTNSGVPATTVTSTLTVGGVSADFLSTTENADTYPNSFTLQPSGQAPAQLEEEQTSQTVTISGINTAATVTITNGEYRINGGAYTSASGSVNPTDTITVRHTSSNAFSTAVSSTLDVGGQSATFTSTTEAADTSPAPFILQPTGLATPATRGSTRYSQIITVSGINSPTPISITNGIYEINNDGYVMGNGTVKNGDTVRVRHIASSSFATTVTSTLTIGGVSSSFSSTTEAQDTTPGAFSFGAALTEQPMNTEVISAPVFINDINSPATVSVTNGSYSINGGTYVTGSGPVSVGQSVRVKHTTSGAFSDTKTTTLTVGGVSSNFVSTTVAQDTSPNGFSFGTPTGNKARAIQIDTGTITVTGINSPTLIIITNGEYRIGTSGSFISSNSFVNAGETVQLRHTTASDFSSLSTTTINIGGVIRNYTTRTIDRDITPDAFTIVEQSGVELSAEITSVEFTVVGINDSADISITDGEYSINNAAFASNDGTVENGDVIQVRHTSASGNSSNVVTTLTVGNVSADFVSTTKAKKSSGGGSLDTLDLVFLFALLSVFGFKRRR